MQDEKTVKTNKIGRGAIRVTIPKSIADSLKITAGDLLSVQQSDRKIIFQKVHENGTKEN
jgi:AbrB family looped-hinge helix DNA binding protein